MVGDIVAFIDEEGEEIRECVVEAVVAADNEEGYGYIVSEDTEQWLVSKDEITLLRRPLPD